MKEVINCSISGVAFTMDCDAYALLDSYIASLQESYKGTQDGEEIIADIEARIAELILSHQNNTCVVERPLIAGIVEQLGSAEAIHAETTDRESGGQKAPRIPRRLYRDAENARLGGVCAGIARYFDVDPAWVRLGMFAPLLLNAFGWVGCLWWISQFAGNLFGVFVLGYLIMWFAVPVARTARQRLEMNGEQITARSIGEHTAARQDVDSTARPIVANAVSAVGQVVLILMKIFAGLIVFSLIMMACGLIIGLFAVCIGGSEILPPDVALEVAVSGIFVVLIPVILLIYVLMCLIASRKPGGWSVLAIFLLWLLSIFICSGLAINDRAGRKFFDRRSEIERIMKTEVIVDDDTTDVKSILRNGIDLNDRKRVQITVPDKDAPAGAGSAAAADDGAKTAGKDNKQVRISVPNVKIEIEADEDNASIHVGKSPASEERTGD